MRTGTACKKCGRPFSHLEILVGSFLPLLVHRRRRRAGEGPDAKEDSQADEDTDDGAEEDRLALARGIEGTGAVGAERDPVCCC